MASGCSSEIERRKFELQVGFISCPILTVQLVFWEAMQIEDESGERRPENVALHSSLLISAYEMVSMLMYFESVMLIK